MFFFDMGPFYDKDDLIENYEMRKLEIMDVKEYYLSILQNDTEVHIEFTNDKELGIFHVTKDSFRDHNWNLKINSPKVDSLLAELNWTTKDLKTLKSKLDKANCISIASSNPVHIGWQRSGFGMFSYVVFNEDLIDEQIKDYSDSCFYIYYKDNIVLEYGGGAVGPQCFKEFYQNRSK